MTDALSRFDDWLGDDGDVAALVMRQHLESVEEAGAVIFPPTYPIEQSSTGYNIDAFGDENVCQIDSVGSQANRMEPLFKRDRYKRLIPQVLIKAEESEFHIVDAGHRAADAIVRFSAPLNSQLYQAFLAFDQTGDAETLARIAPTSIVFGSWDSRATQVKLPRIVRSVIRAFDVKELHRSAQYSTIAGKILEDGEAETTGTGAKSELGFTHVPSVMTHGGVIPKGGIRRDAVLNLVPLRALWSTSGEPVDNIKLRRYILGLCLVALTAPQDMFLREGCHLIPVLDIPSEWKVVRHEGSRGVFDLSHDDSLVFAETAAEDFGVRQDTLYAAFDQKLAKKFISMKGDSRKKMIKQDPAGWQ